MDVLGIPGIVVVQGGAVGVLALVIVAIITGRLVPRRVLEDVRADRDARLAAEKARGDEWRAAALAQDERNDVQASQLNQLLDASRTTNALIDGLRKVSEQRTGRRP